MRANLTEKPGALGQNDKTALVSLTHKINGAARMSGALALAQAAVNLEQAAAAGTKAQLRSAASQLEWQ